MGTARAEDTMDQANRLIHSAEAVPMESDVFFFEYSFLAFLPYILSQTHCIVKDSLVLFFKMFGY
ncbi:hypothetical protein SAMN05421687_10878 [Salimicrobium flavidum]|uniref:Uncharacterized protein n=1 Tax=Salimicrobium flavidum TaxID=570947 RepID=A0A1N7JZH6_9BACI|nr:hypothetical protein SAMN05421687_10878 [Salimicrobium flavidum]